MALSQGGTFAGFALDDPRSGLSLAMNDGVLLTSGGAAIADGNDSGGESASLGGPGDSDLTALIENFPTFDANVLQFDFDLAGNEDRSLQFDLIFGSEEFPEFVGSFNDVFGVYVDGVQVAFDVAGNPLTVNNNFFTLNNTEPEDTTDPATSGKTVVDFNTIEYDGLTPRLSTNVPISPGRHTIKFAIADAGDNFLDSGVFLANLRAGAGGGRRPVTGQPPTARDDSGSSTGGPVVIDVLDNDTDPEGQLVPGSVTIVQPPSGGTTSINAATGEITYTPNPTFSGQDSLTYTVSDAENLVSNIATILIDVDQPVPPVLVLDVVVNDGDVQRSNVTTIDVFFDQATNIPQLIASGDIANVVRIAGAQQAIDLTQFDHFAWDAASNKLTIDLTVDGFGGSNLSLLADGDYALQMDAAEIKNAALDAALLDTDGIMDGVYEHDFHKFLGDLNGDRIVNVQDLVSLRNRVRQGMLMSGPDMDGDGDYDLNDYRIFHGRIGRRLP